MATSITEGPRKDRLVLDSKGFMSDYTYRLFTKLYESIALTGEEGNATLSSLSAALTSLQNDFTTQMADIDGRVDDIEALIQTAIPGVQVETPLEGATVSINFGQKNGSILLMPSGARTNITLNLPDPPRDGQIITIGTTQNITNLILNPLVPTFPSGLATDDNYQLKWYQPIPGWVLLK